MLDQMGTKWIPDKNVSRSNRTGGKVILQVEGSVKIINRTQFQTAIINVWNKDDSAEQQ
jgi:hypothetical protein